MKYCSSCKRLISDDADVCQECNANTVDVDGTSAVTVAVVKAQGVSVLEPALKDMGIPCSFEKTDGDVYNEFNAKINADSDYRVLVPFDFYGKAFDICAGIGVVNPEDRLVQDEDTDDSDIPQKSYNEKFEEANGVKHRTFQMIWATIFIIAACLLIWGIDWIAEFIKTLF
ncbi:MAG: hypothetical protein IJC86_00305 [Clostridia bacterium]|nr:hypothetical protein [Clostridia bacterium]